MLAVFLVVFFFVVILMPSAMTQSDGARSDILQCVRGEQSVVRGASIYCEPIGPPSECPNGTYMGINDAGNDACKAEAKSSRICVDLNGLDDYGDTATNCGPYEENQIVIDGKQLDMRRSMLGFVMDSEDKILENESVAETIPVLEPKVRTDRENYIYLWLEEIDANFRVPPSMIVFTYIVMGLIVIAVIIYVKRRAGKRDQSVVSERGIESYLLRICGVILLISFLISIVLFVLVLFFSDDINFLDSSLRSNFSFVVEPYYDHVYAPIFTTIFQPIYELIIDFEQFFLQPESPMAILLGTCFMIFPSFIIITLILRAAKEINASKTSKPYTTRFKNSKHHSSTPHLTYSYEKDFSDLKFFK